MDVETGPVTLAEVTLADIEEAAERIKGRVRRTSCLVAAGCKTLTILDWQSRNLKIQLEYNT